MFDIIQESSSARLQTVLKELGHDYSTKALARSEIRVLKALDFKVRLLKALNPKALDFTSTRH